MNQPTSSYVALKQGEDKVLIDGVLEACICQESEQMELEIADEDLSVVVALLVKR